jgi:glycerophosphoryl diester phosphodiesterase
MSSNRWRQRGRPQVMAHRGQSTEYPENTLEAYRRAAALGITLIECDVNITRDGVLVMMHDPTLDRTTNGHGPVGDATWDELQRLDARGKFGPGFAGTRIPTTRETLRYFREAGLEGCFEVKGRDPREALRIAEALVELLVEEQALGFAIMSSFDHDALAHAKSRVSTLSLAPERLPEYGPPDTAAALEQARALGAPILQHRIDRLSAEIVSALHDQDIAVWAWPTDTEQSLADSLALGVDAVIGDDVQFMLDALERLSPTTPPRLQAG